MEKYFKGIAAVLLVAGTTAWAGGTVLVAPARMSVIQVGMDLAARNGVTLVSYQGEASTAKPLIHVWNGTGWDYVALEDFTAGKFLPVKPSQTLVIGDDKMVPEAFAPMSDWAGHVQKIPSVLTPELLNAAGTALKFRTEDWQWFSNRYNMKVEDINAAVRKDTVYKHKVGEPIKLRRRSDEKTLSTDTTPPAVIETKKADADKPPVKADDAKPAAK